MMSTHVSNIASYTLSVLGLFNSIPINQAQKNWYIIFPVMYYNDPRGPLEWLFFSRLFRTLSYRVIQQKQSMWLETFLGADGQSLLHSICKHLKRSKFKANLIHVMDFAYFNTNLNGLF